MLSCAGVLPVVPIVVALSSTSRAMGTVIVARIGVQRIFVRDPALALAARELSACELEVVAERFHVANRAV